MCPAQLVRRWRERFVGPAGGEEAVAPAVATPGRRSDSIELGSVPADRCQRRFDVVHRDPDLVEQWGYVVRVA